MRASSLVANCEDEPPPAVEDEPLTEPTVEDLADLAAHLVATPVDLERLRTLVGLDVVDADGDGRPAARLYDSDDWPGP